MWLSQVDRGVLEVWLRHSPCMKFVATPDGHIVWANSSFLEWSGYSVSELKNRTVTGISERDEIQEDDAAVASRLDQWNPQSTTRQQLKPKGEAPVNGYLTLMRYPAAGATLEYCIYTWEPLKEASQMAFQMAMENQQSTDKKLNIIADAMQKMTTETEEEAALRTGWRVIRKYPKLAIGAALWLFGSLSGAATIEILQRTGIFPLPLQIQEAITPPKPADNAAVHHIGTDSPQAFYHVELSTGTTIDWSIGNAGRRTPMSVTAGRGSRVGSAGHSGSAIIGRSSSGTDAVRDGEFWPSDDAEHF